MPAVRWSNGLSDRRDPLTLKPKTRANRCVSWRWLGTESNRRHADFQSAALPTELPSREPRNLTAPQSPFNPFAGHTLPAAQSPPGDRARSLHPTPEPADAALEQADLRARLDAALQALPEHCRLVMHLRWREQLHHAEIATVMGISIKASRTSWRAVSRRFASGFSAALCHRYSPRSTTMGSAPAARRPGSHAATAAIVMSTAATPM